MKRAASNFPEHIAIVGGGRWARVIAGVLSDIAPPDTRLSLCSPGHSAGWEEWLKGRECAGSRRYEVAPGLNELLADDSLSLVLIARAARNNAATAIAALNAGKSVFIEKPFALNGDEAEAVVAATGKQCCTTGLVFLFATNLQLFAKKIEGLGQLQRIKLDWQDARGEERYGETKSYDAGINCLADVFPHVWSILRLIDPQSVLVAQSARGLGGGRKVELTLDIGGVRVDVTIARDAQVRRRVLFVLGAGGDAELDFTVEPGSACINDQKIDIETGYSSPLARELESVCQERSGPFSKSLCEVGQAIEAVIIVDDLLPAIRRDQFRQIEQGLCVNASAGDRLDAEFALRELVPEAIGNEASGAQDRPGLRVPGDESWKPVRDWLSGAAADQSVPRCILNDARFQNLKNRLALRSNT